MIFDEGFTRKYRSLRTQDPAIYFLEDFFFKVLQLNVTPDLDVFLQNEFLTEEEIVTVHFPEFLDASKNLNLIKNIYYGYDVSLNRKESVTNSEEGSPPFKLAHAGQDIGEEFNLGPGHTGLDFKPYPKGMCSLFFGYNYTAVKDVKRHLEGPESLCTSELASLEDDCFTWVQVVTEDFEDLESRKPTVCKFKVEINIKLFKEWIQSCFIEDSYKAFLESLSLSSMDFNIILHPPYISRMSFKDSLKILYPLKTTKLKLLDRISFVSNRSYVSNTKIYEVVFIEKETDKILFQFDSIKNPTMFTNVLGNVDSEEQNSFFAKEATTFEDGVLINFSIPHPIQLELSKHKKYKIRIIAKDLTTKNRG